MDVLPSICTNSSRHDALLRGSMAAVLKSLPWPRPCAGQYSRSHALAVYSAAWTRCSILLKLKCASCVPFCMSRHLGNMCGIFALLCAGSADSLFPSCVRYDATRVGDNVPADELVKKLGARQAHRGPDAQAVLSGPGWALAHQRLSIMDPVESANQPFRFDEDPSLAGIRLVHNGEIYNHEELYQKLQGEGHAVTRHTKTDSEVILHCYAAWGWERCVQSLSGMFAFVIIDERDKSAPPQVLAARDHVGIKPLYMAVDTARGVSLLSSELKAIHDMVDHTQPSVHISLVPAGCAWVRCAGKVERARGIQAGGGVTWHKFWNPVWDGPDYSLAISARPSRAQVWQAHLASFTAGSPLCPLFWAGCCDRLWAASVMSCWAGVLRSARLRSGGFLSRVRSGGFLFRVRCGGVSV